MPNIEPFFILAYGILTLILTAVLAHATGSVRGLLLVAMAAGATYVFQAVQYAIGDNVSAPGRIVLALLMLLPIILTLLAMLVSVTGA